MWSFLKRHAWLVRAARLSWLSVVFAAALYVCNYYWPVTAAAKSWWWTLTLPNAMIATLAWFFGKAEKADHDIVTYAIAEPTSRGEANAAGKKACLALLP